MVEAKIPPEARLPLLWIRTSNLIERTRTEQRGGGEKGKAWLVLIWRGKGGEAVG